MFTAPRASANMTGHPAPGPSRTTKSAADKTRVMVVRSRGTTPVSPSDGLQVLVEAIEAAGDTSPVLREIKDEDASDHASAMDSPPSVMIPASHQDWEAVKPYIRYLYLDQNLTLADVVRRMCTEHNFRATARMYKTQFTRWGWSKYNSKRMQRELQAGRQVHKPAGKSCRRLPRSARSGRQHPRQQQQQQQQLDRALDSSNRLEAVTPALIRRETRVVPGLPHANSTQLCIERVLAEIRNHILWFHDQKSEWKTTPGVDLIQVYNYKAYDTFRSAFDHFIRNEHTTGGEVLRKAFLQVEDMMQTDYSGSFYCHFVELPDLLLHYNRVDVLLILLRHINKLAPLKTRHKSLSHIFLLLQTIVQMDPAHLSQYVEASSLLWKNMLAHIRGEKDRTTLMAKRSYLRHAKAIDRGKVESLVGEYDVLLAKAIAHYGEWNVTLRHMEDITLGVQHNHAIYLDDFVPRSEGLIRRLRECYPPDPPPTLTPEGETVPISHDHWSIIDRNIYSNAHERLASYYYRHGDAARAVEHNDLAQVGWTPGVPWNLQVEQFLTDHGMHDVAEKISWTRLEGVYWDEYQNTRGRPTGLPPSQLAIQGGASDAGMSSGSGDSPGSEEAEVVSPTLTSPTLVSRNGEPRYGVQA